MTTNEIMENLVEIFGSKAELARRLNLRRQTLTRWHEGIPAEQAIRIEILTKGKVKAVKIYTAAQNRKNAA